MAGQRQQIELVLAKGSKHLTRPRSTYDIQIRVMHDYIAVLEERAIVEGVTLPS